MVKSQLLFIIAIISGFLLTLQLITLQVIVRRSKPEANSIWRTLYAVTTAATANDISLFVIDPNVLRKIANHSSSVLTDDPYCKVLCANQIITHLATLGEYSTNIRVNKLTNELRERGYTVFELSDVDPSYLHHEMHISVLLHLLIFDEKLVRSEAHVVHIVIFHEKLNSFWWSGRRDLIEHQQRLLHRQGVKNDYFNVIRDTAIYEKVEIIPTIIDGLILNLPKHPEAFLQSPDSYRFIECNKTRAKEFNSKYPLSNSEKDEATIFRSKVKKLLVKVSSLLDQLNVPFWLSSGTCLGYFRQCDTFAYGVDVDIGIFATDYNPAIIDLFSTHDLPLIHVFGKPSDSFELSFRDGDLKLDIFFFYTESDHYWNGGTQVRTGLKFKYDFAPFKLCWSDFLDLRVRVPCETQSYIESNYGKTWFEPVKVWDWKKSPSNVKANGQWPVDEWHQVIQSFPVPEFS